MKNITRKENHLKIPNFLHELHGDLSNWRDVGLTHTAAWGITGVMVWLSIHEGHVLWMTVLLAFLMVDIAGGVVSNFTRGTNNYYSKHPQKRTVFLLLHVIQPGLLAFMFPDVAFLVLGVMAYALPVSFWLDDKRGSIFPKTAASFFTILGISAILLMPIEFVGLQLLLILYITKLILAFSVDWHGELRF